MSGENALVLVVDDEPSIRNSLSRFLKMIGFKVEVAENGEEALEICRRKKIRIILSDIQMPGEGGIWLLNKIRKDKLVQIVFLMTGDYASANEARAQEFPPEWVFQKPFKIEEISNVFCAFSS